MKFPLFFCSEGRRVALQPICLPPLANTAGRQGGFHDVDCFGANELNPYPFFDIENKTIHQVCKPTQEGKTSFISTRKNKEGCFTIGYGPVPAGTPCLSSCWTEDDYPNKNVVRFSALGGQTTLETWAQTFCRYRLKEADTDTAIPLKVEYKYRYFGRYLSKTSRYR